MDKQAKRDFGMAMATLFEAFAVKPEDAGAVRIRAYEDGLKDVPAPLLNAAVRRSISTRTFFPKVAELRMDAESERKSLLALHAYDGCCDCEHSKGWIETQYPDGVRARRCPCWKQHMEKLAGLGVSNQPLALPAATSISEWTRVGEDA